MPSSRGSPSAARRFRAAISTSGGSAWSSMEVPGPAREFGATQELLEYRRKGDHPDSVSHQLGGKAISRSFAGPGPAVTVALTCPYSGWKQRIVYFPGDKALGN